MGIKMLKGQPTDCPDCHEPLCPECKNHMRVFVSDALKAVSIFACDHCLGFVVGIEPEAAFILSKFDLADATLMLPPYDWLSEL